jgi:hypothetical protein
VLPSQPVSTPDPSHPTGAPQSHAPSQITLAPTPYVQDEADFHDEAPNDQSSKQAGVVAVLIAVAVALFVGTVAAAVIHASRRQTLSPVTRMVVRRNEGSLAAIQPSGSHSCAVRLHPVHRAHGLQLWTEYLRAIAFDSLYFGNPLLRLQDDDVRKIFTILGISRIELQRDEHPDLFVRLRMMGSKFLSKPAGSGDRRAINDVVEFIGRAMADVLIERAIDVLAYHQVEELQYRVQSGELHRSVATEACYAEVNYDHVAFNSHLYTAVGDAPSRNNSRRGIVPFASNDYDCLYAEIDDLPKSTDVMETATGVYVIRAADAAGDGPLYPMHADGGRKPSYATCPDMEQLLELCQHLTIAGADRNPEPGMVDGYALDEGMYAFGRSANPEALYEEPYSWPNQVQQRSATRNHRISHPEPDYDDLRLTAIPSLPETREPFNFPGVAIDAEGYCTVAAASDMADLHPAVVDLYGTPRYSNGPPAAPSLDHHLYEYDHHLYEYDVGHAMPSAATDRRPTPASYDLFLDPPSRNLEPHRLTHTRYAIANAGPVDSTNSSGVYEEPMQIHRRLSGGVSSAAERHSAS